tara:strand:- start:1697 stop:1906 length:210 start_codon:yes stop_codon:yes gene_type:complete
MLAVMTMIIGGLFYEDNKDFFATAHEQYQQGYTWSAIDDGCRAPTSGTFYIASINEATGEEIVCFKLEK